MFNFNEDYKKGKKGENYLIKNFPGKFRYIDDTRDTRKGDLIHIPTGYKVEVKTDYYISSNFFLEWHSNTHYKTWGGPIKAMECDCRFFVYIFMKKKEIYFFNCVKLAKWLKDLDKKKYPITTLGSPSTDKDGNQWYTSGILIPRKGVIPESFYKFFNLKT